MGNDTIPLENFVESVFEPQLKSALTIYIHHVFYGVSVPDVWAEKGIR